MPYSDLLADRIRAVLAERHDVIEKGCSAASRSWLRAAWPVESSLTGSRHIRRKLHAGGRGATLQSARRSRTHVAL
jgi:hypothetical protein